MDLLLWRHAEAEDAAPGTPDLDRALTAHGRRQAERMAAWLQPRLPTGSRIVVSPALRTQQTAQALGRPFATLDAVGPGASPGGVLAAAGWPDAGAPVLVVGHQPTLGLVAARLLGDELTSWSVERGAVWWLRLRDGQPVLQAVRSPDDA